MKVKAVRETEACPFKRYRALCYGPTSIWHVAWAECLTTLIGLLPGAAGLFLRSKLYPGLFAHAGRRLLIGRNVTFRHLKKIRLGDNVIIDDNAVIDAKGETNNGLTLGDNVFIGRNTIIYCKDGDIKIESGVSLSANCTVVSSNRLTIEKGTVIGAYSYLLSGGEYDYTDSTPFAEQSGMQTTGELVVGSNCWLGARVTVLDGASVGEHCVIGAGAVVTKPIPPDSLALGIPAKVVKAI